MEGDIPAHFVDQFLRNHQAQPGAAVASRNTGIRLAEGLEQARLIAFRNADTGIADLHFNLHFGVTEGAFLHQDIDIAALGKFDGIADQIGDDLLQTQWIANHIVWHVVLDIER